MHTDCETVEAKYKIEKILSRLDDLSVVSVIFIWRYFLMQCMQYSNILINTVIFIIILDFMQLYGKINLEAIMLH